MKHTPTRYGWNPDGNCKWCGEAGNCHCYHPQQKNFDKAKHIFEAMHQDFDFWGNDYIRLLLSIAAIIEDEPLVYDKLIVLDSSSKQSHFENALLCLSIIEARQALANLNKGETNQ